MADYSLNSVASAAAREDGSIVCRCNITTPDGGIWDTDFIVRPPMAGEKQEAARGVGLPALVYDWVVANPDQVTPYVEGQEPVPREEPVQENAPPPPIPPPLGETGEQSEPSGPQPPVSPQAVPAAPTEVAETA